MRSPWPRLATPSCIGQAKRARRWWTLERRSPLHGLFQPRGTKDGLADGPFNGWSVIEAADLNAAAKLLADHPFIGRGGVLQISEPAAI